MGTSHFMVAEQNRTNTLVSMDTWKPTLILPHLYEVSRTGGVRRIKSDGRRVEISPKETRGYMSVCLWSGGKPHWKMAHRLAWESHVGPIADGLEVNHINGVKSDNRLENLEIVTRSGNALHMFRVLGHKKLPSPSLGEKNGSAKLTAEDVREIRRLSDSGEVSRKDLAARFGMTPEMIGNIARRQAWRHI